MIKALNNFFDKRIEHLRIHAYGTRSKIRTTIREEPMKLGQYLRGKKDNYHPIELKHT